MIKFEKCQCEVSRGDFKINEVPLDCPAVWQLLATGNTVGVFQLEKSLGQDWAKKTRSASVEELAALTALLRPGPLECIGENTLIARRMQRSSSNGRISIERIPIKRLYSEWNKFEKNKFRGSRRLSILSVDTTTGEIIKNKIIKVIPKGRGQTYSIKTRTSWTFNSQANWLDVRATENHFFRTNNGWKQLKEIVPGDYVAIFSGKRCGHTRRDNAGVNIDGYRNFRNIAFYNWQYRCVCCDWSEASLDVNHLNGNRETNNSPENLVWLCPNHHRMYTEGKIDKETLISLREQYKLPKMMDIRWALVEEVNKEDEQELYDIAVDGPHNNYLAGNFVVHNSNMTQDYVDIKFRRKTNSYIHPALKLILDPTYGCLVYQEQAIKIATDLAGLSPESADELRKAIGKKKPELMAKIKAKFIEGAQKHKNIGRGIAEEIFGWIEKCQRYSFNKCVSGKTIIRRPNGGRHICGSEYTVEHMYKIRNDISYAKQHGHKSLRKKWKASDNYGKGLSMCADGRIRQNTIEDIQPAGRKRVYKLTLTNGSTISATANHKFPTPSGEKMLVELAAGDFLYVCGTYEESDFNTVGKFSEESSKHKKRPYQKSQCGFPVGSGNPAYTNGSYTDFKKYKEETPDICEKCGDKNCRIEVAHLNGDRKDSSKANLQKLCASCHKKHDYSNGRVKRGEKGYSSQIAKIESIVFDGMVDTWDITMAGPNHNLVVNGDVVTCNSHAVSYGMIAYHTAWAKCHFPHEFFTSYLTFSNYKTDPKDEIYRLVQDARLFGVEILPPNITRGNIDFEMTDNPRKGVAFGLSHIRGVGSAAIEKIAEAGPDSLKTWTDFLSSVPSFHRNVGIALIKSGACDCYGMSRSSMVRELEVILGTTTRNMDGKKIEVKGLTPKEKDYFFEHIRSEQLTAREVLLQMSQPASTKTKSISQMLKPELLEAAREYLSQAATAFDEIKIGDSTFVYTSDEEKDAWLDALSKLKKTEIKQIMLDNGYSDKIVKPPCSSDARRRSMAEKAELLECDIKDTNTANATAEKYFLGISLSCSPTDDVDNAIATHTCLEVAHSPNDEHIVVCAIIDSVKHTKTKRGKNPGQPMCFLTMSDSTYSIDHAVVFPDSFGKLKGFCKEDVICLVYGEKKNGSFIIKDIQKIM